MRSGKRAVVCEGSAEDHPFGVEQYLPASRSVRVVFGHFEDGMNHVGRSVECLGHVSRSDIVFLPEPCVSIDSTKAAANAIRTIGRAALPATLST